MDTVVSIACISHCHTDKACMIHILATSSKSGILMSFARIHPPDVIGKYAPESVIGNVGSGVAAPLAGAAPKAGGAPARTDL